MGHDLATEQQQLLLYVYSGAAFVPVFSSRVRAFECPYSTTSLILGVLQEASVALKKKIL